MAPLVRTGGSRHTGLAALPHRNIQNFIFIKPKTDAVSIVDKMKSEKQILIKSYSNVGNFGTCLRVTIGARQYMERFLDALFELDNIN